MPMQLSNTDSSLPTARMQPYLLGLIWGTQDLARGVYSRANARHLATSFSTNADASHEVLDGYTDAPDDSDEPRRCSHAPL